MRLSKRRYDGGTASLRLIGLRSPVRVCILIFAVFFTIVIVTWTTRNLRSKIHSSMISGEMKDAATLEWYHAANSKSKIIEALKSSAQMIEADVIMRGHDPEEPIMAHPPQNDSDITLRDWLKEVTATDKGIKLDFKSLQAVKPSMRLLEAVRGQLRGPVWINADILSGPGGKNVPLDPQAFLEAVGPAHLGDVLSLGWTTGWSPNTENPGYSWEMVREMEAVCHALKQPVTFPVRAALLPQSYAQLSWLLQQSSRIQEREDTPMLSRYSLTVWTGLSDEFAVEDLIPYRMNIDKSKIYYDLLESQSKSLLKLP